MTTRFVIAGMQRSGTTVTQRVVQGHPEVCMAWAEIAIEPFFGAGFSAWTFGNEAYAEREAAFGALFDAVSGMHADARSVARGFKVAVNNANQATVLVNALAEYLPDVRLIVTRREDLVAQFGSLLRAQQTGEWHSWVGGGDGAQRLRIDEAEFVEYARDCLEADARLRSSDSVERFEVSYERDVLGGTDSGALFDFLGVARMPVSWRTTQKTAPPPQEYIENYDAMCGVLAGLSRSSAEDASAAVIRARLAGASSERDYVLVRRAERFFGRGDDGTACEFALLAIERGALVPASVWLPAVALLEASIRRLGEERSAQFRLRLQSLECEKARDLAAFLLGASASERELRLGEVAFLQDVPVALGLAVSSLEREEVTLAERLVVTTLERSQKPSRDETEWASQLLEQVWQRDGAIERAVSVSARLAADYTDDPAILEVNAVALVAAGRTEEAQKVLARVLDLDAGRVRAQQLRDELG